MPNLLSRLRGLRPALTRRAFWLWAALITLLRCAVTHFQLAYMWAGGAPLDDELMFRAANAITSSQWLGEYDYLTLSKSMFFAVWLALLNKLHLPYLLGGALLWCAAALLAWIADIKAPKPQHVFIVHGDREVAPYFAESVEKLGFTAHAPQYTEVYDLIEDQIVAPGYLPERKAKAVGGQRVSSAYERLVALGQRMVDVIRRSKGRDNKTLGRWADQLRQLLDKWEES